MLWQTTHPSLLSRLRDNSDHAAWNEFDRQYGDLLVRYCRGHGLQFSDAQDVRQMVMLGLARAMPKFRYMPERGLFRSYLGQVVRRAVWHFRQRNCPNRGFVPIDIAEPEDAELARLDESWEREWVRHHLRRAMHAIRATQDPRSVEAFEQLVAGHSIREVAMDYGMSEASLQKIKQRMRDRLKKLIQLQVQHEDEIINDA